MEKSNERAGRGSKTEQGKKHGQRTNQPKEKFLTEEPDPFYKTHRHQSEFDMDIEDPNAYRERQENYVEDLDLEDDPGTFEN